METAYDVLLFDNNHELLVLSHTGSLSCLASTLIRMWRQWTRNLFSLRTVGGCCLICLSSVLGLVVGCHGNYHTHLQPIRIQPERKKALNQLLGKKTDILSLRLRCRRKERLLSQCWCQHRQKVKSKTLEKGVPQQNLRRIWKIVMHLLSESPKRGEPCAQFEVLHQWKNPAHMKVRSSHSHRPRVWLFEGRLSSKLGQWPHQCDILPHTAANFVVQGAVFICLGVNDRDISWVLDPLLTGTYWNDKCVDHGSRLTW